MSNVQNRSTISSRRIITVADSRYTSQGSTTEDSSGGRIPKEDVLRASYLSSNVTSSIETSAASPPITLVGDLRCDLDLTIEAHWALNIGSTVDV